MEFENDRTVDSFVVADQRIWLYFYPLNTCGQRPLSGVLLGREGLLAFHQGSHGSLGHILKI